MSARALSKNENKFRELIFLFSLLSLCAHLMEVFTSRAHRMIVIETRFVERLEHDENVSQLKTWVHEEPEKYWLIYVNILYGCKVWTELNVDTRYVIYLFW